MRAIAAMVLVRVRRWIFSRRNSSEIFFFAIGYFAASHGPTCSTLETCSSTAWLAPSGGALTSPSTTTHVPVALSSSIACTSARTTHCRFTGPVPSLISRKHSAPLSATRPVLTQPPTTMEAPMSDAPFSGHACTAETETRSYSLLYLFLMVPARAAAPSAAVCFACTAASTAASCALSSPRSMSARAAMMVAGEADERRERLRRARASRRVAGARGRPALD